jgi:hypothetical protein
MTSVNIPSGAGVFTNTYIVVFYSSLLNLWLPYTHIYVHAEYLLSLLYLALLHFVRSLQSTENNEKNRICIILDSKSRNIPEVVLVRRWAVGVLGIWKGGVDWVKGEANGVSLQAT